MPRRPDAPSSRMKNNAGDDMQELDLEALEKESNEVLKLLLLTKENAVFSRTSGGFADLKINDTYYPRVVIYKIFPFSDPDSFLSVREPNEKAKEIGIIQNLKTDFSEETVTLLYEQMHLRYFTPKIHKINSIKEEYGYAYFDVETDHGICHFTANSGSGTSIVNLSDTRLIINDLDGNRFEIADITKLTAKELKKLDVFL
jgi:Domain of unknown function (DUF1854).